MKISHQRLRISDSLKISDFSSISTKTHFLFAKMFYFTNYEVVIAISNIVQEL